MTLRLRPEALATLNAHLARAYPEEGCGLLVGREADGARVVERIVPAANRHDGARRERYEVAAEAFLAAERAARGDGLEVLGFFHSHPDRAATPSAFDLERAWAYYSYLIVRVEGGAPGAAAAWRLSAAGDRFEPEEIEVAGDPGRGG
jgi:proteasome lid subunit RPN8/RPN11